MELFSIRIQRTFQLVSTKYNKPLFFGVAAKKEIINYAKNLGTWTFSWTSALYWCCPISKAHNLQELINALKK